MRGREREGGDEREREWEWDLGAGVDILFGVPVAKRSREMLIVLKLSPIRHHLHTLHTFTHIHSH